MTRRPLALVVCATLITLGTVSTVGAVGTAHGAPATWTPSPVAGFSGRLEADQPKLDSSRTGAVTAAWFGDLPEEFGDRGNVLVSTYSGQSWGCPIQLPGTTPMIYGVPPAFDVAPDGTTAVAASRWDSGTVLAPKPQDVWVSVRRAGSTSFAGAGTGEGFPVKDDPVVATSAARTVVVWVTGNLESTKLMGAEFLPGAKSATPVVLAAANEIAFAKIRMDSSGNAVVAFRSIPGESLRQNWLIWPAGSAPGAAQAFSVDNPDDFVESKALSVSPNGRMLIAMYSGGGNGIDPSVVDFTGTTTTGFTTGATIISGDPLPATDFATGIDDTGHATVAFRMDDVGGDEAVARIYAVDPVSGAAGASGQFTEPGDTGIGIFRIQQSGATAYIAWIDSNSYAKNGGVVSFDGGGVTRQMATSESDWVGVVQGPKEPVAYWPAQSRPDEWQGTLTTTLQHKALGARPAMSRVSVQRSGAITVKGQVTPGPAAKACAGASVAVRILTVDRSSPQAVVGTAVIGPDGTFSWSLPRSAAKGCSKARVTAYLQTPDSPKPVAVTRTVNCSR